MIRQVFLELFHAIPKQIWIAVAGVVLILALQHFSWYPKDNALEQKIEETLVETTGIEIDLTP